MLGSLCSTLLNHRTDEYGGSFENRIRYALEVVAAMKEAALTMMIEYNVPYNWTLPVAKKVKAVVSIPISTVGRVLSVENGEEILRNGDADIISYGRSLLCDPDIALKVERRADL